MALSKEEIVNKVATLEEQVSEYFHQQEMKKMKSMPLFLNRMGNVVPANLDKQTNSAMGDMVKESTLNDGKKVFILQHEVYQVFPDEFKNMAGIHIEFDQTALWARGLHLELSFRPVFSGLIRLGIPKAIQIEKGAFLGTLYYKSLL